MGGGGGGRGNLGTQAGVRLMQVSLYTVIFNLSSRSSKSIQTSRLSLQMFLDYGRSNWKSSIPSIRLYLALQRGNKELIHSFSLHTSRIF